jgi:hypothetical protein
LRPRFSGFAVDFNSKFNSKILLPILLLICARFKANLPLPLLPPLPRAQQVAKVSLAGRARVAAGGEGVTCAAGAGCGPRKVCRLFCKKLQNSSF